MKNIFRASIITLGMLLCLPMGSVYAAENDIEYYENGGTFGYTSKDYSPEIENEIDKMMEDKMNQDLAGLENSNNQVQSRQLIWHSHTDSGTHTGMDSRNTNARSQTTAKGIWGYKNPFVGQLDTAGSSKGEYAGPSTPSKIVLNQSYVINGTQLSVSVSLPPSASYSADKSTGSWQSQPLTNRKIVTASYPTMRATTTVGITSVTFTDTADIYFGGTIYRPTSRVTLK